MFDIEWNFDENNCGACGKKARAYVQSGRIRTLTDLQCDSGACYNRNCCAVGETSCRDGCKNLSVDPNNCGSCGNFVDITSDSDNCNGCRKKVGSLSSPNLNCSILTRDHSARQDSLVKIQLAAQIHLIY